MRPLPSFTPSRCISGASRLRVSIIPRPRYTQLLSIATMATIASFKVPKLNNEPNVFSILNYPNLLLISPLATFSKGITGTTETHGCHCCVQKTSSDTSTSCHRRKTRMTRAIEYEITWGLNYCS